jgi:hypothetical protein
MMPGIWAVATVLVITAELDGPAAAQGWPTNLGRSPAIFEKLNREMGNPVTAAYRNTKGDHYA